LEQEHKARLALPIAIIALAIFTYNNKSTFTLLTPQESIAQVSTFDASLETIEETPLPSVTEEINQSIDVITEPSVEVIKPLLTKEPNTHTNTNTNTDTNTDTHTNPHTNTPPTLPFFSQFKDISSPKWQKVGCGIASLAMLIAYYEPGVVEVDTLLSEGISAHAYLDSAGWTHAGLIGIAKKYGLGGASHDLAGLTMNDAFDELKTVVAEGPVMVSVHYTLDPQNPIPHLVVLQSITDDLVYYSDPAEKIGNSTISITRFESAWKKRYIEIRPLS
jgi:predicted double-glycine peptidase